MIRTTVCLICLFALATAGADTPAWEAAAREPEAARLARPSPNQYNWHEQERTMFVHFGVATWEGTEYDADGNVQDEPWRTAHQGTLIGGDHAADFGRVTARYLRLKILKYEGPGVTLWSWDLHDRPAEWETVGAWRGGETTEIDLSTAIHEASLYEMRFTDAQGSLITNFSASVHFDGIEAPPEVMAGSRGGILRISRSQAIGPGASSRVIVTIAAPTTTTGTASIRPAMWQPDSQQTPNP